MGGQQHARGGGAMRRDARPLPRASDGRGASALTPWLFPHEKANSRCNGTREQKKRKTEIMVQFFIWTYTVQLKHTNNRLGDWSSSEEIRNITMQFELDRLKQAASYGILP